MAQNPLKELAACGQSVWSDYIRRTFITNGDLQRLVDDGVTGVTSNPTIFEKAIGGSSDYDDTLAQLVDEGKSTDEIFVKFITDDIRMAADVLRPVYDASGQHDGFVSIEVSPQAAHDTQKTLEDAHTFWQTIQRPNIMIKVPGTPEGIPAIEQLIYEGINVNITLLFAVEVHEQVMEAYLRGLERRIEEGKEISQIASVASFFVSRVDTLVDKLLEEKAKGANADTAARLKALEGKAAIANAKIAYEKFEAIFGSERFSRIKEKGGQVQRVLWASTSTKNPSYPDTMYVTTLVGPETVNTMPLPTIQAVKDHGEIECGTVQQDVEAAHQLVRDLADSGIEMGAVTDQLTVEGVKSFQDSLHQLDTVISEKAAKLKSQAAEAGTAELDGQQNDVDGALQQMKGNNFLQRLWDKDPTLWKPSGSDQSEITDRLGWLHVSDCMLERKSDFRDIADYVRKQGFSHAVVLGMGGSSLAPYVFAQSFGQQQGFPELLVLDSTDPLAIEAVERTVDLGKTLFLVSTKSGTTTETLSFFKTFWEKVQKVSGERTGDQFIAITDPGTALVDIARQHGFHHAYLNPTDIGGRYSAMSYFGLIPAAVMGVNVEKLLDRALQMEQSCAPCVEAVENPGAWLGTVMAICAQQGRDKVTFFLSPEIASLGLWLEQLLAESTGKEGKGLVPVPDNPPGAPGAYAEDHLFIEISIGDESNYESAVAALRNANHPVVRLRLNDLYDMGAEFFRWEFATAVAGALLQINAFNQPNVQESKDNTGRLLKTYESSGSLPEPKPTATTGDLTVTVNEVARSTVTGDDAASLVRTFLEEVKAPQYLAIMAYIAPDPQHDKVLTSLRVELRDALKVAVTLGYGPRFLHSTGQLHKGGPPEGVFLQITSDAHSSVPVPGETYSYETLIKAQALGDFQSLQQHGRPALRVHLQDETESVAHLQDLVREALQQPRTSGS